ncbi:MAG: family 43 glycosylhydrolase [Phycisphaerales bacterium]|nr:family 43 glycosylhydrolase [Phycisphaerales bacterium]
MIVRYLDRQPDGELAYWTWLNHNASGWSSVSDLPQLAGALQRSESSEFWIRIEVEHTPATLNNSYFRIHHSGSFMMYVNGDPRASAAGPSDQARTYHVSPRRPEVLGKNLYAIHFQHEQGPKPIFDVELVISPWVCVDPGTPAPEPIIPDSIRDAQISRGPDEAWYLTGTTGDEVSLRPGPECWLRNPGIQLFRSTDLKSWSSLGYVWTFERDGTWNKEMGSFGGRGPARGIFAPEFATINDKYWLSYSVNNSVPGRSHGIGLLVASQAAGPYREISPDHPLTEGFDPHIFVDDDGTVYLLKHGGHIARMKPDMSGLAEPFRHLPAANYPYVGYEGVSMFKYAGRYYLTSADWNVHEDGTQSYDSMIASSDSVYGPYGPRYCALRYGGHNSYFEGPGGELYATIWCYPDSGAHWQKVSIIRMDWDAQGRLAPVSPR